MKPVEELRVRITSNTAIPEPANIQTTGDWYYLDHISSGLAAYDADKQTFGKMLASSWDEAGAGVHTFTLKPNLKFSDGSPITTRDILWTIKRHLKLKTATHFPFWEYLVGCDHIQSLNDECEGLKAEGDKIIFKLKSQIDSFYLQMASPETGIWSADDMDAQTARLTPTKFSGAYYVSEISDASALLKRNPYSPLSASFPDSPKSIRIKKIPLPNLDDALLKGEVDLVIKQHTPMGERDWRGAGLGVHSTTPSSMIYLFGLGTKERPAIGRDIIQAIWKNNVDPVLSPADTYLPFTGNFGLKRADFLEQLPQKTASHLRIACPDGFFPDVFIEQLSASAKSVGTTAEFFKLKQADFFAAFNDPKSAELFDYVLSIYAASERYPAVQLRYLTKSLVTPPIDLKEAEAPDQNEEGRAAIFQKYEKWLLQSRQAIPLYFDVTLFVHRPTLDIGRQSKSDAEIELWRVRERAP